MLEPNIFPASGVPSRLTHFGYTRWFGPANLSVQMCFTCTKLGLFLFHNTKNYLLARAMVNFFCNICKHELKWEGLSLVQPGRESTDLRWNQWKWQNFISVSVGNLEKLGFYPPILDPVCPVHICADSWVALRPGAQNTSVAHLTFSLSGSRCDTTSRNYPGWECANPWHSHAGEPRCCRTLPYLLHMAKIWCPEWILDLLEENGSDLLEVKICW